METINKLIDEHEWVLLSFRERYGNGVWVVMGTMKFMLHTKIAVFLFTVRRSTHFKSRDNLD